MKMTRSCLIGHIVGLHRAPEAIPGESDRRIRLRTANGFGVCVLPSKSSGMLKRAGRKPLIKSVALSSPDSFLLKREKNLLPAYPN